MSKVYIYIYIKMAIFQGIPSTLPIRWLVAPFGTISIESKFIIRDSQGEKKPERNKQKQRVSSMGFSGTPKDMGPLHGKRDPYYFHKNP